MRDVFEAIEQLSALLAMRVERVAAKRGWACRSETRVLGVGPGRQIHLISLTVSLPQSVAASFTPRPAPTGDGWTIDVRRSDGVLRRGYAEGVQVGTVGGQHQLLLGGAVLEGARVETLLDDLARPGPSGVALWVRKVWAIRFGRMPMEVGEILDRTADADRLDEMHGAVLRALDPQDARVQLERLTR